MFHGDIATAGSNHPRFMWSNSPWPFLAKASMLPKQNPHNFCINHWEKDIYDHMKYLPWYLPNKWVNHYITTKYIYQTIYFNLWRFISDNHTIRCLNISTYINQMRCFHISPYYIYHHVSKHISISGWCLQLLKPHCRQGHGTELQPEIRQGGALEYPTEFCSEPTYQL